MKKQNFKLRSVVTIVSCLIVLGIFSACKKHEAIMCVATKATETGYGYANYKTSCLHTTVWDDCSHLNDGYDKYVEVKRYADKNHYTDDGLDACYADEAYYAQNGPFSSSGGGNKPAMCDGGYVQPMPNGYVQSNVVCENTYYYICTAGFSPSSAEVKQLCDTYKIWQTHDDLKDCKYCK